MGKRAISTASTPKKAADPPASKASASRGSGKKVKKEEESDDTEAAPQSSSKKKVKKEAKAEADAISQVKKEGLEAVVSPTLRKKLKDLEKWRQSPFPQHDRPSPKDCQDVCDALSALHGGEPSRPVKLEKTESVAANCGAVPDVLNALLNTILSQNTSSKNSTAARRSLDARFKSYDEIRLAPQEDVAEALAPGGLANVKSKVLKKILDSVWEKQGRLSLDYLHDQDDEQAMRSLLEFDGVGPKTASCVLLFCLNRNSFAVDTHIFRLTKALKWVPEKATRETTFQHLDAKIPDHLKYPLHSLLIQHGRSCSDCSANGVLSNKPVDHCALKPFLRGKRPRDVPDPESSPSGKGRKKAKKEESDEDEYASSEEDVKPKAGKSK